MAENDLIQELAFSDYKEQFRFIGIKHIDFSLKYGIYFLNFKHWAYYPHRRFVEHYCSEWVSFLYLMADLLALAVEHCQYWKYYYYCFDSNYLMMLVNWMRKCAEMDHWVLAAHLMSLWRVHQDKCDTAMVFVMRLPLLLAYNTNQLQMLELLVAPVNLLHTAMHPYMMGCHIVFGMQHNCQLLPIIPVQRRFVVSISFCKYSIIYIDVFRIIN